jgi:hypothetical protein
MSLALATSINKATGANWTRTQLEDYGKALANGTVRADALRKVGTDAASERKRNRDRIGLMARSIGLPQGYVQKFIDKFIEYGDTGLALADVRESKDYDTYFPGNRNDDGTVQYSESEYQQVVEQYASILEDYGVNPDAYASKFGEMIGGKVAPPEFAGRVEALSERIVNAPPEARQAFASEFGLVGQVSDAAILGVSLSPDIGQQVFERRLSIAQLTGSAKRFGFARSRGRVEELMNSGMSAQEAGQFYSGAAPTVQRLSRSAGQSGEAYGIGDFEDAAVMGDNDALSRSTRLDAQERARFSGAAGVQADRNGGLTGLNRR